MHVNIHKFLNDTKNKHGAVTFDRNQEDEISIDATITCIENEGYYIVVKDNLIKDYFCNNMKNKLNDYLDDKDENIEVIENVVKTQYEIFKKYDIEGLITLFLDYDISKKIQDFHKDIYVKSFIYDNFLTNNEYEYKQGLSKDDFKEALRIAMNQKDKNNLLEVKVKSLEEEPEVFYQGNKMDVNNFTGLDYGFKYEDEVSGKHYLNVDLDEEDGTRKVIKHL